ncbi:hypothetical protein VKT23_013790 [Stygiomarasmius scandens]|uniref:Uncharacterized protein n=1 Tax=Marasmiellus scandens TaxID=2682957 RepID=A0ABR1J318_9AGAR
MTSPGMQARSSSGTFLTEDYIQDAFHSYLKSSLTQARIERLLDTDVLSSAEGDLMITGPALCLYFAALRCTTNPPSVPLPRNRKNSNGTTTTSTPTDLSPENCPPAFRSFLSVWARNVPPIQTLAPEHQHDLARIICGLEPITGNLGEDVYGIAADLRAVAIEISQRRSFQDRYAADLQAALDGGPASASSSSASPSYKASFVPPPSYEETSHSPSPSPTSSAYNSAQSSPNAQVISLPHPVDLPPQDTNHLSPFSPTFSPGNGSPPRHSASLTAGRSASPSRPSSSSRPERISIASTASSATLRDEDPAPTSPPFPVPQIPIGHGTYYPPHIPVPSAAGNGYPPIPPPKDRVSTYTDDGYGAGSGNNAGPQYNTTKPLKLQKHRKNVSSVSSATSISSRSSISSARSSTPSTPSILTATTPAIDIIRETLYATLADVLSTHPSLRALLKLDPSRAYFGSVSLAILDVATNSVHSSSSSSGEPNKADVTVRGVLGKDLTLSECPDELRPFMVELGSISRAVIQMREEDDERAIKALQEGRDPPVPRYDRVRIVLEEGVGGSLGRVDSTSSMNANTGTDRKGRSRSPSGRAVAFANRINALALGMTRLRAFRERQGEVFKVLAAASGGKG